MTIELEALRKHLGTKIVEEDVASLAPLFDTAPFSAVGRPVDGGGEAELWAVTPEGTIAMQATARFA